MVPAVAELQKQARVHPFDDIPGCSGYTQGRWPRQETLTLLEVCSRLDHRFKEAAHKAHLWDEVSRIMEEERQCREKLENLYKYYKKTKEAKTARQDGKHYRFFRQLEALYGGATTTSSGINPNTNEISAFVHSSYRPIFNTSVNEVFASSLSPSSSSEEEGWGNKSPISSGSSLQSNLIPYGI